MRVKITRILVVASAALLAMHAHAVYGQKPELEVETGHTEMVNSVAFSPNGRTLASGSEDNTVKLWDVSSGRELRTLAGHSGDVRSVAFSPDGRTLASGSWDDTIKLWEVATGRVVCTLAGHSDYVEAVTFSADGRTLASGSLDHTIKLWDVAGARELRTLTGHTDSVESIAFSPDGRLLASGSDDHTINLWDVAGGRELRTFTGHTDSVKSVAFSPDGHLLASGSSDKRIKLWDISSGREISTLVGHSEQVLSVAFSIDGLTLASGAIDGTVKLWDVDTGSGLRTFADCFSPVAFSPDGRTLATGGMRTTIKLWDLTTGRELHSIAGHIHKIHSVAFSPDGRTLASGSSDRTIKLWDVADERKLRILAGHSETVSSVAFSPDGSVLASGSFDKSIKLWNQAEGRELHTLAGHTGAVTSVAFSPDGRMLASGSFDKSIRLWDAISGHELYTLTGHKDSVYSVAFSPNGNILASESLDRTIKLWDVNTGVELLTLAGSEGPTSLVFSPDGRTLALGSDENLRIKLWDLATGSERELDFVAEEVDVVVSISFSRDGRTLASGNTKGTIELWDVATGHVLRRLKGHTNIVGSVGFNSNGRYIVSASWDGSVRYWDSATGNALAASYALDANEWAVVDPRGRFDASPGGMSLMHFVVEKECGVDPSAIEPIDLDQLKNRYYEPGLLPKVLGFNKEPLRDVSAFDHVDLYPDVQMLGDVDASGKLTVKLTNCGGGIGPVQVFVNDKQFIPDARGARPDANAKETTLTVDLQGAPLIPGKKNDVRVVAWNAQGYVHSRGEILNYAASSATFAKGLTPLEAPDTKQPEYRANLYAVIVGISKYSNKQLNLHFSGKDAESMAKALQIAGDRLFGCSHVHIFLLSSEVKTPATDRCAIEGSSAADEVKWAPPTKANIQRAFEAAGRARPEDVLVVYFSGHGVAVGDTYVYPTADANTIDPDVLSRDSVLLSQTAVTSDELANWVNLKVPATHEVMILDTCAAGAAAVKLAQMREVPSDQTRALDRLKDNTGFHLLMGAAADAVSYEANSYGQGLLTYALLEGMKGAALKNDVDVDVIKLFEYAADRVPGLAHGIGGIQRPLPLERPGAESFAIGEVDGADRARIPIAVPLPVILAPRFMDPVELSDNLSLEPAVSAKLRDATDVTSRGGAGQAWAVFVPAEDLPGAIRPSGTYSVANGQVTVKLGLIRDNKLLTTIVIQGPADDIPALAAKVVNGILSAAKTIPLSTFGTDMH